MRKRKRAVAILLILLLIFSLVSTGIYFFVQPKEYLGSSSVYNTVTLQLDDTTFYDVRVPVEANLLYTDGTTVYDYDLISVGIQDTEPISDYKVKVGNRWVYAQSEDGWLKATLRGFEEETAYTGSYDTSKMKWTDTVPGVVMELDADMLDALREGQAYTFGENDFIISQLSFGTFDVACERSLMKMSTLFHQDLRYGMKTSNQLWVTSNRYTVAVSSVNYNTCLLISAYGEKGRQYAAALMGESL